MEVTTIDYTDQLEQIIENLELLQTAIMKVEYAIQYLINLQFIFLVFSVTLFVVYFIYRLLKNFY